MINHVFTRKASDGAVKFRGGLALVRQYRFLAEEEISQWLTGPGVVASSLTSSE
jgi:hypothetical protein